eukprot:TRINITY_DN14834_c0_g1_i1.p1 TRINITY_DN14834_c0_g1~~TRINITY_DN14834_c0_g1_i1.p1  ORF type:complete len:226 (+),score=75.07 TRINITY_DN14834_c0_g1_i1:102-779(+)
MPVYCAIVARLSDLVVLSTATHKDHPGFDAKPASEMLDKARGRQHTKLDVSRDGKMIHYLTDDSCAYVCVTDDDATGRKSAQGFLEEVRKEFRRMYLEDVDRLSSQICKDFKEQVLNDALVAFSKRFDGTAKLRQIDSTLQEVKGVMVQNIDRVIERGERIETIVEHSEELETAAEGFRRTARGVNRRMWWEQQKMRALVACAVLGLVLVILVVVCGITFADCRN